MKPQGLFLALIAGAHALPVIIEHGHSPVPERAGLTGLMEAAPDADTAADQLLQYYQKHGYPAVGVEVEDLKNTRRIKIEVSKFKNVLPGEGPTRTKKVATDHFAGFSGEFVNQEALKSQLATFHANPLHRAVPRLQPDPDGVSVNAFLNIEQSLDHRFSTGYLNTGAHPLPRERFWIQSEIADLWNRNSLTTARLTFAPDPGNFHALQIGSRFFQSPGTELATSLSYSGAQASDFNAYTWQLGGQWRGATQRWQDWSFRPILALGFRRSNNALEFGDATNRGLADVVQFTFGATAERTWETGLTRIAANLVTSPFGNDDEHDSLRPGAQAEYSLIRTSIWHRQDLPSGWDLIFNLGGQWSSDPVLQADQFALGGASGIRGLPEQFALGDNGYLGGLELRAPVFNFPRNLAIRPSIFLQSGQTFDEVLETNTSATTAGAGLQIGQSDKLRVSIHAGWRLDEGGANVHGQLTWNF